MGQGAHWWQVPGAFGNEWCLFLCSANLKGTWLAGGDFEWQEGADSTELRQAAVVLGRRPWPQSTFLGAASPVHLPAGVHGHLDTPGWGAGTDDLRQGENRVGRCGSEQREKAVQMDRRDSASGTPWDLWF